MAHNLWSGVTDFYNISIIYFSATKYHANVNGASFVTDDDYGRARATEIMNSKSGNDYRWSVRITSIQNTSIYIGIASQFQGIYYTIVDYDHNAILYYPASGNIYIGGNLIHEGIIHAQYGDEVHFRFQPMLKKFSISFVSVLVFYCVWSGI